MGPVRRGRPFGHLQPSRRRSWGNRASAWRGAWRGARLWARTWRRGGSHSWLRERSGLPVGEDHPTDPALAAGEEAAQEAHLTWQHLWWANRCGVDPEDRVPGDPLPLTLENESILRISNKGESRRRAAKIGERQTGEPRCNVNVEWGNHIAREKRGAAPEVLHQRELLNRCASSTTKER